MTCHYMRHLGASTILKCHHSKIKQQLLHKVIIAIVEQSTTALGRGNHNLQLINVEVRLATSLFL